MARTIPKVWVPCWSAETQSEVQLPGPCGHTIRLASPAWWAWLEEPSTVSFAYPIYESQMGYIGGWMTVRKEYRVRGSQYWVAYRRIGGRLRKLYLGRSSQLTQRQLAATAERFLAMGRPATDGQKEVMPGQWSGASLEREAMMRREKSGQRVVHIGRR